MKTRAWKMREPVGEVGKIAVAINVSIPNLSTMNRREEKKSPFLPSVELGTYIFQTPPT